jgi:transcriptional regulator with XRE-family HTH domain
MDYNNILQQHIKDHKDPEIEAFVNLSFNLIDEIHAILAKKGWTQNDLAEKMGKTPAEVSKWISGSHNLTIKSIAKLSAALEEDLIMTVSKAREKFQHKETVVKVVTVIKPVNVILPQYITSEKTDLQVVYKKLA